MNRFILIILAVSFPLQLWGQMFPLSDHYVYNALAINPAFEGCNNALSATIIYRNQLCIRKLLYLDRRNMFPIRSPAEDMEIEYQIPLRNYNIDWCSTC